MAITYQCILEEAERAASNSKSEAAQRTAICRSYYAFYHASLEYADKVAVPPVSDTDGPTHSKLRCYFMDSLHSDKATRMAYKRIGYTLKRIHSVRVRADYFLGDAITVEDAEATYSSCKSHIELVESLGESQAA